MKTVFVVIGLLISGIVLATTYDEIRWLDPLIPHKTQTTHNNNNDIIMKHETMWIWDTRTKTLSFCFKVLDRDDLCTNVPKEFAVTYNGKL
jgi:hypothetical protein